MELSSWVIKKRTDVPVSLLMDAASRGLFHQGSAQADMAAFGCASEAHIFAMFLSCRLVKDGIVRDRSPRLQVKHGHLILITTHAYAQIVAGDDRGFTRRPDGAKKGRVRFC